MHTRLSNLAPIGLLIFGIGANAADISDSGALDTTFGSAGKAQIGAVEAGQTAQAMDVAIQPDGKTLVAGYESFTSGASQYETWRISRLNSDGSLDVSFGNDGVLNEGGNASPTRAQSVAVRPDGRIVAAGTLTTSRTLGVVYQLTTSGAIDVNFNHGMAVVLQGINAADGIYLSRVIIDTDGTIVVAGTNYDSTRNVNRFFFDRISADGTSDEPFYYEFGSGDNQDDHALDLAIDSQKRYVLVGYHRGPAGNYDCAAIRIRNDLYDVDSTFGSGGQTTIAFDYGGDNGDFCNSLAIFKSSGYIAIGGHASVDASNNQEAVVAMLTPDGAVDNYVSEGNETPALFAFTYGGGADPATTASKLIIDNDDSKNPLLLAVGTGARSGSQPYGDAFGIARLTLPFYIDFTPDPTFNGSGVQNVYFVACPGSLGLTQTGNAGQSAAYVNGKLVVAGYTTKCGAGTMAVARFAAFDRIRKDGFDIPSY